MQIRHPSPDERPRILVVEPNRTNLGVMSRRLSEAGYRVTTADNGEAAIAELYRLPIELVLAELNMPRMSGAELARAIRGEVQWNDIPVMLITGKSDPKGAVRAYEAGADDVILKPFHFEVLFARIDRRIVGIYHAAAVPPDRMIVRRNQRTLGDQFGFRVPDQRAFIEAQGNDPAER